MYNLPLSLPSHIQHQHNRRILQPVRLRKNQLHKILPHNFPYDYDKGLCVSSTQLGLSSGLGQAIGLGIGPFRGPGLSPGLGPALGPGLSLSDWVCL